jgi:predicted ribonuclease YlaK
MVTKKRVVDSESKPQHGLKMKLDDMLTISPKTEKQKEFFDAYQQGHYFCALSGVAGTGKTYIAFYKALEEVMDRSNPYGKLVIIRSSVQSREMGHLPGDAEEKMNQFTEPYKQIAAELFKRKDAWDRLVSRVMLSSCPPPLSEGLRLTMLSLSLMRVKTVRCTSWTPSSPVLVTRLSSSYVVTTGRWT